MSFGDVCLSTLNATRHKYSNYVENKWIYNRWFLQPFPLLIRTHSGACFIINVTCTGLAQFSLNNVHK